jgi:hypothetical protein
LLLLPLLDLGSDGLLLTLSGRYRGFGWSYQRYSPTFEVYCGPEGSTRPLPEWLVQLEFVQFMQGNGILDSYIPFAATASAFTTEQAPPLTPTLAPASAPKLGPAGD